MNYYLIGFFAITTIGLIVLAKKMKIGREDWNKLKSKFKRKKKLTEVEIELKKNGLVLSCDKRDYADMKGLKEAMKDNPEVLKKLNNIDEEWKKFGWKKEEEKE